ncbi:DUF975 family protein [Fervidicella metallireducens]|uniref:DUF975 family protein n=1 Tax=Fervidicella metallireducens TaxID=655338 RepID=UPI001FA78235|nr:DUF975 family protein [Fervidicella metallireducens]
MPCSIYNWRNLWFYTVCSPVVNIIIAGPLALGLTICFVKLVREEPFRFENLFDGFKNFKSAFLTQLLISIFVILWSLLLFIPGIIAGYSYSMAFYILNDNPEIGAMEAIKASKEMMKGYKWKLFCLHLSFIGWALLCILTLGIGFLWLTPYVHATTANFYQNLKESKVNNQINPMEISTISDDNI